MYPRLSDIFKDLFGLDIPLPIYSFGFMVATAIIVGAWLTRKELDRMHRQGQLGSVPVKEKDAKGRERTVQASPGALVWNVMIIAAVSGVIGSKVFHIIDYWDRFVQNPMGILLSGEGLTFYGGLIFGTLAVMTYLHRKGLRIPRAADAFAPGVMLAYGIGRIGCYLSGDGDWGRCSSLADKPGWIPNWLWSETFPRNILGVDVTTWDRVTENCALPQEAITGVYPTMLYEFAMAAALAGILWLVRKHPFKGGWLFSLYLVFNGIERFVIELIKINPESGFGLPQSQIIALALIALGFVGLAVFTRRVVPEAEPAPAESA